MPIPILIGIGACIAGAIGVKKGLDAKADNDSARHKFEKAQRVYEKAKEQMEDTREQTSMDLVSLGELKLRVWDKQLGRFVQLVEKVKSVRIEGQAVVDSSITGNMQKQELAQMKVISLRANEVISGGASAIGSGALVCVASYGGATFLGSASSGTALASLSGAAATNATLAWFGGGSLAAGGLGIAGGVAVLGGIITAPILAVGGFIMAARARENLAEAKKSLAEAEYAAEQMNNATSMIKAISSLARDFEGVIQKMDIRMSNVLDNMETQLQQAEDGFNKRFSVKVKNILLGFFQKKCKLSYEDLGELEKRSLHVAFQFAQATKILLETPLMAKDGSINHQATKAIEPTRKLLAASN